MYGVSILFFRYLHVFSSWNGGQGHDGLVAGCFFTRLVSKRMGNGSVIPCRAVPSALCETGTQNSLSLLVTLVSHAVRAYNLEKNSRCMEEFALRRFQLKVLQNL